MPRAVFKYAWDRLLAGHEVFAYVNNLASNGDNYWVLAHMTPSRGPDGSIVGFHSSRRVPDRAKIAKVLPLYSALLEQQKTYDEWVWSL